MVRVSSIVDSLMIRESERESERDRDRDRDRDRERERERERERREKERERKRKRERERERVRGRERERERKIAWQQRACKYSNGPFLRCCYSSPTYTLRRCPPKLRHTHSDTDQPRRKKHCRPSTRRHLSTGYKKSHGPRRHVPQLKF